MNTTGSFKDWFQHNKDAVIFSEIGETQLEKKKGSELFADPAMETALYMSYRQAYDPVRQRDTGDPSAKSWSHGEWTYPSSGGTRAPNWTFYGSLPNETDLAKIRQALESNGNDVETTANQLLASKAVPLSYLGGVTYYFPTSKDVKITGTYGTATMPKMMAMAHLSHDMDQSGREMFLGVDKELKDLLDTAQERMPKFFEKGKVPAPKLAISQAPKEVIPLLYNVISSHPAARGSGNWEGFNKDTGALQFNLSGTGMVDKYIYGNKAMWKTQISRALKNSAQFSNPMAQAMIKTYAGQEGELPQQMVGMVNGAIKTQFPEAPPLSQVGVKWLLQQIA